MKSLSKTIEMQHHLQRFAIRIHTGSVRYIYMSIRNLKLQMWAWDACHELMQRLFIIVLVFTANGNRTLATISVGNSEVSEQTSFRELLICKTYIFKRLPHVGTRLALITLSVQILKRKDENHFPGVEAMKQRYAADPEVPLLHI